MGHLDRAEGHPDKTLLLRVSVRESFPVETGRHGKAGSPPWGGWGSNCGRPGWNTKWRDDLSSSCLNQLLVMKRHLYVSPVGSVPLESPTAGPPLSGVRYKPFWSEFFSADVLDVTLTRMSLLSFQCSCWHFQGAVNNKQVVGRAGLFCPLVTVTDSPGGTELVRWGCHYKVPQTRWLKSQGFFCLMVPEAQSLRPRRQQGWLPLGPVLGLSLSSWEPRWSSD